MKLHNKLVIVVFFYIAIRNCSYEYI